MTPSSPRDKGHLTLGIDPGSTATGYGLVLRRDDGLHPLDYGVIRPGRPGQPLPARLGRLFDRLEDLLARWSPDVMAVESLFSHRNVRSAITLAQTRGVVLLAAARAGVEIREYTPRQVKMAVAGYGGAEKRQVKGMVCALLGLRDEAIPLDAADALGVALCEAQAAPLRRAVARAMASPPPESP
jgi:crossover junction endodeoxyribonuclease RuvC